MSVENKIKELLDRKAGKQQLTENVNEITEGEIVAAAQKASAATSKDTSKSAAAATAGDKTQPKQGSSQEFSAQSSDEDDVNLGAKAASGITKAGLPTSKGDAKSVKIPNMKEEEDKTEEENKITDVDISSQLNAIFGEDLSEEFKAKATSIFEAAIIARVNNELDKVIAKLEEHNSQQLQECKDALVEKVDGYLNYIVEQWYEENAIAIDQGLRTEIAEDFINGLQQLFKEHYIDVPEERYDVMEELTATVDELTKKLDEAIENTIQLNTELEELQKAKVIEEMTKGLAATEVEKLKKLVEGVDFENENLYREKVTVIKENYFPKLQPNSPEKVLVESAGDSSQVSSSPAMSKYVDVLSRSVKAR